MTGPDAAPVGAARHAAPLLLNVNDRDASRYMVGRMLKQAGFRVAEARTGTEALLMTRELLPRLIVLDINLPDINGMEVCRRLKADALTESIKVLHTSAVFVDSEYKVQSLDSGADAYLAQPFEREELLATVHSLMRLTDAEQRLRDTAGELREANDRIHRFLAMLAHELRNPLSAITASLPLIGRRMPADDTERTAREVLSRQSGNLRRLVDDLLDVARVTQGKIEPQWEVLDIAELLERVAQNARRTRADRRGQQLDFRVRESPLMVRGDPLRLEQVFVNLIDNATKYTPEGGRIEVEVGGHGGSMRAVVRDNGAGIPEASLGKVFDLFMQADVPLARAGGGLGVGLTVVHALVSLHGGQVCIHSDGPGSGTEVVVTLPLAQAVEPAPAPSISTAPADRQGRRVLIIEDNFDARESLRLLLEMWGHEVHVEGDGIAGVQAILAQQPDVALVDIGLPLLDGHQVAQRVSSAHAGQRPLLVALSGYGDAEQREAALRAGFDMHLVKPVDPDQLDALVRNATRVGA